jgi:SAM-dependent methyltransferase
VLEHILDDEKAIQNIYAPLKEGGYAFFHVPLVEPRFTFKWIFERKHQPDHVREGYQIDELRNILQRVAFSIIKVKKTFGRIGRIGWEIDYILGSLNKYLKFAFIPLMRILSSIDRVYSKNGKCAYFLVGKEKN